MKKYLIIFTNSINEYFAFRVNFILWRLRFIISVIMTYFLWESVFLKNKYVLGYDKTRILTYILLTIILNGIIFSTRTYEIAADINYGSLSKYLIKPINYFKFYIFRDLSDKFINTLCSIIEFFSFLLFLKPVILFQQDFFTLLNFSGFILLAICLFFEISLILSFFGFWSNETWAPRFLFSILVAFLSGNYFPLDIFPSFVYEILQISPFPYLIYYPLKIYLGEIKGYALISGFFIEISWIFILYILLKIIWRKGLMNYTSEGQ